MANALGWLGRHPWILVLLAALVVGQLVQALSRPYVEASASSNEFPVVAASVLGLALVLALVVVIGRVQAGNRLVNGVRAGTLGLPGARIFCPARYAIADPSRRAVAGVLALIDLGLLLLLQSTVRVPVLSIASDYLDRPRATSVYVVLAVLVSLLVLVEPVAHRRPGADATVLVGAGPRRADSRFSGGQAGRAAGEPRELARAAAAGYERRADGARASLRRADSRRLERRTPGRDDDRAARPHSGRGRCAAGPDHRRAAPRARAGAGRPPGAETDLEGQTLVTASPRRASAAVAAMTSNPGVDASLQGRVLQGGKYQLIELIARGGMASVWSAQMHALETIVAVKVLAPSLARQPEFRTQFQAEAHRIAQLHHPNIIEVYDFEAEDELLYIAMRYVRGGSLIEYMRNLDGPMDLSPAAKHTAQLASPLNDALSQGLVLQDVKPANVLLGSADWPLLSDFGIAGAVTREERGGHITGTPPYMSPEQWRGETLTGASDQYSLAVMFYQLVTRQLPFQAETQLELQHQVLSQPPLRPRELNPGIPGPVEEVVLRALAKRPFDRFDSIADFSTALLEAVERSRGMQLETKQALVEVGAGLTAVLGLSILSPALVSFADPDEAVFSELTLNWPILVLALAGAGRRAVQHSLAARRFAGAGDRRRAGCAGPTHAPLCSAGHRPARSAQRAAVAQCGGRRGGIRRQHRLRAGAVRADRHPAGQDHQASPGTLRPSHSWRRRSPRSCWY